MLNIECWKVKTLKSGFWTSCSDIRSQNKLLWSMKGVEILKIQSFKGFWKSRKIPELDFWESRDWDFEKIPGYPGIPQEPDDNMQKSDPVGKLAKKSYGTTRLCTLCLLYSHPFCKSSSEVCKKKFMLQIFAKKLFGCHFSWVITKKVIWCNNFS